MIIYYTVCILSMAMMVITRRNEHLEELSSIGKYFDENLGDLRANVISIKDRPGSGKHENM